MADNRNCAYKSGRIKTDRLVIVEGKYDKIKTDSLIDAEIIITDGFGIFKDSEKKEYIKKCAEDRGILILTDSDRAGFKIRNFIRNLVGDCNIENCYIPEIKGREKRKKKYSAEGTLGVEGVSPDVIHCALCKCDTDGETVYKYRFSSSDLYEMGLLGRSDSKKRRDMLKKELSLPQKMNNNLLQRALSKRFDKKELETVVKKLAIK